jgi:hypothetical protein
MPRRAAEPAGDAPEAPEPASKSMTIAAMDAEARALCERRRLAHEAARWAFDNGKGSRAACSHYHKKFGVDEKKLTYNMVEPLYKALRAPGGTCLLYGHRAYVM